MPSNPSLIPTGIVDKNGKQTTVYRRSGQRRVSDKPMPAPSVSVTPDIAMANAFDRLSKASYLIKKLPAMVPSNLLALAKVSPTVLDELVSHIENADPDEVDCWAYMLTRGNYDPESTYSKDDFSLEGGDFYRRHMTVKKMASSITWRSSVYPARSQANKLIDAAEQYCAGDYGANYSRLRAGVIVLGIKVLHENDDDLNAPVREGQEGSDIEYLAKNIDAAERVIEELTSRRTTDPEIVSELIGSHAGLANGAL